ncbi:hypothetical protein ACH42_06190, partial [Endozoicomonas sp. (ex Bugula neritina AB1)]
MQLKTKQLLPLMVAMICSPVVNASVTDKEAEKAYVYAFSMDEAYKNVYNTIKTGYPLNRFQNIRELADDTYTSHPTINNDTLHLMGWLDVAAEPVVVTVPEMTDGRYWQLHTMDMGHYTNSTFGSRNRGVEGGRFMYAAKGWSGEVPKSIDDVVYVDSHILKLMGRIMAVGQDDTAIAQDYMDGWNIRTLSEYLGQNGPEPLKRDFPNPENTSWVERVNFVLCDGSLEQADQFWLKNINTEAFGLGACKTDLTEQQKKAAVQAKQTGMQAIQAAAPTVVDSREVLGTRESIGKGDRVKFSVGTFLGQWGLPAYEATYRQGRFDQNGQQVSGQHDYTMTFDAPDVSEFWSVTVYSMDDRLMASNDMDRFSRGDRTLKKNSDGTYTITLGSDTKGRENDSNFLPTPDDEYYLILRMYG